MTLAETLLRQLDDPALSRDEQARLRCRAAADLESRGRYEAALEVLGDLWRSVGQRPALEGLSELTAAEVLLRVGALSGWLGSVRQIEGAQDAARDLISESISRFQTLGEKTRVAAARGELGLCYRRAGSHDEARVIYGEALKELAGSEEKELRATILLRLAVAESISGHYSDALHILTNSAELFEESGNDALKGHFHNDLACFLTFLSKAERRSDYRDRAIIEYTAAAHHFELAGCASFRARAENNLGFLLHTAGHHEDAHEHLNCARRLFIAAKEKGRVAQVDETRARVFLAQGHLNDARRVIGEAVLTLERGGEQGLLAEALTTQGRVLAKLGDLADSQSVLKRAADLAEQAGAVEDAGCALLSLMEEHADGIAERDLLETYLRANNLLRDTQDAQTVARLRDCAARIVSARLNSITTRRDHSRVNFWANFNLPERVRAYEARYIRRALTEARGSITHASRLLGFDHPTKLAWILRRKHKDLAHLRTPPEKRRRSIIVRSSSPARPQTATATEKRPNRILHVEDNEVFAVAVKNTLEAAGWSVATCKDGAEAMKTLAGDEPFDLLISDYDLPGRNGAELIRHARTLPHRRRLPSVMISATDVEREAWAAGADAFLRKPEDVDKLTATISRLLKKNIG